MTSIKASIIVPCYNVEQYLPCCLESLVNQTLEEIEIICINDGSPDNCIQILRDYEKRYPEKIIVIDKENEGVWRARLDGIAFARGEYIGFVDGDDYAEPNYAETLFDAAQDNDADMVIAGFRRIDIDTGKIISHEMNRQRSSFTLSSDPGRIVEINGAPWNKLFRASVLKEVEDLPTPPPVLEDVILHLLAYKYMNKEIAFIPHELINYRVRVDSAMNTLDANKLIMTYSALLDVKHIYLEDATITPELNNALDTLAFLHLGISLMHRVSMDGRINLKDAIRKTTKFLDDYFPTWRTSPYMTASYSFENKGAFLKLFLANKIYKAGLLEPFLKLYQMMIEKLLIDIKW